MQRGTSIALLGHALMALGISGLVPAASGHTLPISYLSLAPDPDYLHLELTLNPFELNFYAELDWDKNGRLDALEWEEQQAEVTRILLGCLVVRVAGKEVAAEVAGTILHTDSHHATLRAHYPADTRREVLSVESSLATLTSGSHFTQVNYGRGDQTRAARLDLFSAAATFEPLETAGAVLPEPAAHASGPVSKPARPAQTGAVDPDPPIQSRQAGLALVGLIALVVLPGLAWIWAMARPIQNPISPPKNPGPAPPERAPPEFQHML